MKHYYTDERNAQIVISLLKAHNIKKIIASPGTTNVCFIASVQQDDFFQIISAPDERSAAYIACGMAAESGEPVVLSCTGATASRNYMPGLTEAYYRQLPILVITSSRSNYQIGHNIDQVTDRTQLPKDVVKLSVQAPLIFNSEAEWAVTIAVNKAILELNHRGKGPAHINLETDYSRNYDIDKLPFSQAIYRFSDEKDFPIMNAKKVVIMVGAHLKWSNQLSIKVNEFCKKHNAIVLCDQTSNYKGKYRVLANIATQQVNYHSVIQKADIMIHIGDVSASKYNIDVKEVWRVNPDGILRDPYKKLKYVFEISEETFFQHYSKDEEEIVDVSFINEWNIEKEELNQVLDEIKNELPFSNIWIASQISMKIPNNSILHLGIQNSLRSWNFFEIPESVLSYSNTGGFGIDGCISTAIGAALVNPNKIIYCILGDLAFFYDFNSLGNKHLPKNLRILLINNGLGIEFKIESNPAYVFGQKANKFIAASGHYGAKSRTLVKNYSEALGFRYFTASNKDEFNNNISEFISNDNIDYPLIFEVFTNDIDENTALHNIRNMMRMKNFSKKDKAKQLLKNILNKK